MGVGAGGVMGCSPVKNRKLLCKLTHAEGLRDRFAHGRWYVRAQCSPECFGKAYRRRSSQRRVRSSAWRRRRRNPYTHLRERKTRMEKDVREVLGDDFQALHRATASTHHRVVHLLERVCRSINRVDIRSAPRLGSGLKDADIGTNGDRSRRR